MRRLLASLAIIQLVPSTISAAFTFQLTPSSLHIPPSWGRRSGHRRAITITKTTTALPAKKKSNKNSNSGGGGFGSNSNKPSSSPSSSTTATTNSNSNSNNNANMSSGKIRSVSGYTGSGTKALRAATNAFDTIYKECNGDAVEEKKVISDVYVKSPLNDPSLLWFVGKVARCLDTDDGDTNSNRKGSSVPTEFEAVLSQKRLILEWAKNQLRPQNLGGPTYSQNLEIWIAPGNSEMDAVQNKVSLTKVVGSMKDLSDGFSVGDVGFNPEIYIGDEKLEGGLRVRRDLDGQPIKPEFEINA